MRAVQLNTDALQLLKEYDREAVHQGVELGEFTLEDIRAYLEAYDPSDSYDMLSIIAAQQCFDQLSEEEYLIGRVLGFTDEDPDEVSFDSLYVYFKEYERLR